MNARFKLITKGQTSQAHIYIQHNILLTIEVLDKKKLVSIKEITI